MGRQLFRMPDDPEHFVDWSNSAGGVIALLHRDELPTHGFDLSQAEPFDVPVWVDVEGLDPEQDWFVVPETFAAFVAASVADDDERLRAACRSESQLDPAALASMLPPAMDDSSPQAIFGRLSDAARPALLGWPGRSHDAMAAPVVELLSFLKAGPDLPAFIWPARFERAGHIERYFGLSEWTDSYERALVEYDRTERPRSQPLARAWMASALGDQSRLARFIDLLEARASSGGKMAWELQVHLAALADDRAACANIAPPPLPNGHPRSIEHAEWATVLIARQNRWWRRRLGRQVLERATDFVAAEPIGWRHPRNELLVVCDRWLNQR